MSSLFTKVKETSLWGPKLDPVAQAISDAQEDEESFPVLMALLDPVLGRISRRLASQCVDDALQEARIRVWRKIQRIDMERPATAKAYVMKAAVSGIRDAVRKWLREHQLPAGSMDVMGDIADKDSDIEIEKIEFDGILGHYLTYVEETGSIAGAHKHVGVVLGVTTARASTLFHMASRDFIVKYKEEQNEDS